MRVHRGVYRVVGAPITRTQQLLGVTWALNAVASHKSAAAMHDLGGFTLDRFEVTRPADSNFTRDLGGVVVRAHRSNFLPEHHTVSLEGIATTTLARTLCDLSARMSTETLERVIDDCKRRRLIEYEDVAACRLEIKARGRRRTTVLDEILGVRVDGYAVGESPPEDSVRTWLEDAGFHPIMQHRVVINGDRRRLDLALVEDRIAIEYQGIDAHATHGAVVNDSRKVTELQLAGWFVVLVTKDTTKAEFLRQVRDFLSIRHA